jgi:hypothetical protein
MTNPLTLATASTHGGSVPSPVTILLVVAAVGYVLWSRMQGRPLKMRRLILLPVILVVLGITDLTGSSAPHLTSKDIAFLVIGVAISAILGAARGATIQLYSKQGELWQRYRKSTVGLWVALIVAKVILLAVAGSAGASAGGGTNSLLLSLGISLLAEAAIVGPRAVQTGLPFATGGQSSNRSRPDDSQSGRGPIHHLVNNDATMPPSTMVRPPAPPQAQWGPPRQSSVGYQTDGRRSDRRRNHRGPINRLLGANDERRRDDY